MGDADPTIIKIYSTTKKCGRCVTPREAPLLAPAPYVTGLYYNYKGASEERSPANGKNKFVFSVVIEKDNDGYFAYCPAFQGCYTQGDSYEETIENIQDAIRLHIEDYLF